MRLIFLLFALWASSQLSGQGLFVNTSGSGVYLRTDAEITVQGKVSLQSGTDGDAFFAGIGTISAAGWENYNLLHGGINAGDSLLVKLEDGDIAGTTPSNFNMLQLQQDHMLLQAIYVEQSLHLDSSAMLFLNGKTLSILSHRGDALTADGTAKIVSESHPDSTDYGVVYWDVSGSTDSVFRIPFGNSFSNFPLIFQTTTPSDPLIAATYATSPDNMPLPAPGSALSFVVSDLFSSSTGADNSAFTIDRFWILNTGTNTGVKTSFHYDSAALSLGVLGAEAMLEIFQHDGISWTTIGGVSDPPTRSVQATVADSGVFTMALYTRPLSIHCLEFAVEAKADHHLIYGYIENPQDRQLQLEKSPNAIDWQQVQTLAGGSFQYEDPYTSAGTIYFRVADSFGASVCETVASASLLDFSVQPNPASDWVRVLAGESKAEVLISNWNGAVLIREHTDAPINVSNLANGIYPLCVLTGSQKKCVMLSVNR